MIEPLFDSRQEAESLLKWTQALAPANSPLEELEDDNATRHWIGTVERDVNYAVAVSTCAGLWGYILGDTVRFVGLDPPRILVTGRISYSPAHAWH